MTRKTTIASKATRGIVLIVFSILGFTAIAAAAPAHAQCSASPSTERAIESASSVFVGRVTDTSDAGRVAQVQVLSIWKGRDLPETVEVRGTTGTAGTVDRRFDTAKTYLFIPENTRVPFLASACSATQSFVGPANIIPTAYQEAVGATTGRIVAPDPDASALEADLLKSILPLIGLIALIGITWAVISHFRGLEPERAASFPQDPEPVAPAKTKVKSRRRSMRRDIAGASRVKARTLKKNSRGFRRYRRRQQRQLASSRKASGSTDTS